jgi:sugar-specific transcriptional regulator TrmB
MNLGLSFVQAKTYLNLAKLGKADIATIAKVSDIARQDTYRIMSSLENLGLAEKVIAKPIMYEATPIKDGLQTLLQKKEEDYVKTKKQVEKFLHCFSENSTQSIWHKNVQFSITSEFSHLIKTHNQLSEMTKNSIDMTIPVKITLEVLLEDMPYIERAIRRGVRIRLIAQKGTGQIVSQSPEPLFKNPLFELRYLPESSVLFGMHIFDKREMTLAVSEEEKPMPSLWTNSSHVVKLAAVYFEDLWNAAQTENPA